MNTATTESRTTRSRTLAVACLMLGIGLIRASTASSDQKRMPSFSLAALNGSALSHKSLAGNVALVDFWATWCKPCLDEIPRWNTLQARYGGRGLTVLGIAVQSGPASEINASVDKLKIDYRIVIGDEKVVNGFDGVTGFPTTFLVDRKRTDSEEIHRTISKQARSDRA